MATAGCLRRDADGTGEHAAHSTQGVYAIVLIIMIGLTIAKNWRRLLLVECKSNPIALAGDHGSRCALCRTEPLFET